MSSPAPNRVDTLTATVDQLQAEIEWHNRVVLALSVVVLCLVILMALNEWERTCRP